MDLWNQRAGGEGRMDACWARVTVRTGAMPRFECAGQLTPYAVEAIGDQAVSAGVGTRIDVAVADDASDATIAWVMERLTDRLQNRGISIDVHRGGPRTGRCAP